MQIEFIPRSKSDKGDDKMDRRNSNVHMTDAILPEPSDSDLERNPEHTAASPVMWGDAATSWEACH